MTATIGPVLNRSLAEYDPAVAEAIGAELNRQRPTLEMIAAENFAPVGVLEAQGLVLTSTYAEGGCEHVDVLERLAIDRVKALFGAYPACPVAAGRHLSPVPHAHVTMTTTHKAPRRRQADQRPGTRREGWRRRLPVRQGGPLENVVAAKGVAAEPEFLARRQRTRRGAKLDGTQAEDRRHEAVKPGFDAGKLGARVAALAGQFPLYLQETR